MTSFGAKDFPTNHFIFERKMIVSLAFRKKNNADVENFSTKS